MAKRFRRGLEAPVRGVIYKGIREGKTKLDIYTEVEERFGIGNTRKYQEEYKRAVRRSAGADAIRQLNLRRKPDWKQVLGCEGNVRVYISLTYRDDRDGGMKTVGYSTQLDSRGALSQQLNRAINEVREHFIDKKYGVPEITSADNPSRSPNSYYRVEYAECV